MALLIALPNLGLLAAAASFVAVMLLLTSGYWIAGRGRAVLRNRVKAYSRPPLSASGGSPAVEGRQLLRRATFSAVPSVDQWLRRGLGPHLALELTRAGVPLRVGEYLMLRLVVGLGLLLTVGEVTESMAIGLLAGLAGYFAPVLYLRMRQRRRVRLFEDQLSDALLLLSNALKSGYSMLQGMETVGQQMPDPIGPEFTDALQEIRMGAPAEDALMAMARRVRSADFELVATAMVIERQVGGNLSQLLEQVARTVRERHRLLREAASLSAEERLSGYVIAAIPLAMMVILSVVSPGYLDPLLDRGIGRLMLGGGFALEVIGLLMIRKIVEIEV